MVETGLVMGLIAILAVATLWVLSEWLSGTFVEEAEGTGSENVREFYDEMADIADGRQINSTSVASTSSTIAATTSTGATTTSTAAATTSTGEATTSTAEATTSTAEATTTTATTSTVSTTSTSVTTTTSTNTSTTSTTVEPTTTTTTTATTTTVIACNPVISSVATSGGTCNWTSSGQGLDVKKNTTFTVTVALGGDTFCVTHVAASFTGNAVASVTPASDASSPYQFTITVQNAAALWSRITFTAMENTAERSTFNIEISTVNASTCP